MDDKNNEGFRRHALPLLLLAGVMVWYFLPVLSLGHTFFFRDVMKFGLPEKWFQWHTYLQGAMPYWNPTIFNGVPFFPLLHPNAAYPLNILLFTGDFPYGFNLFVVVHHAVLVFSVYALMRFWGMSAAAATASAFVAGLGGYFLSIVSLGNQLVSTVWTPLVLLAVQKYLMRPHWGWLTAAVIFVVMQILGGSPESCVMSTLMVYFACVFITPGRGTHWKRPTLTVAGLSLTAIALTAFQLVPTYRVIQRSVRAWDLDPAFNTKWSLEPETLRHLFAARDFDTFMTASSLEAVPYFPSVYMGVIPALALVSAAVLVRRREVIFWTAVFFTGLFFALGGNNPVYTQLLPFNPLLQMFRYPEKFFFFSAFAMTFLTGYFIDHLFQARARHRLSPFILACVIFGTVLASVAVYADDDRTVLSAGVFAAVVALAVMVFTGRMEPRWGRALLVLVVFIDLWTAHSRLVPFIDKKLVTQLPEVMAGLPEPPPLYRVYTGALDRERFRSKNLFPQAPNLVLSHILEKETASPNLGTVFGLQYADGLMAIELENVWLWTQMFRKSSMEKKQRMLERNNVRYWVAGGDLFGPESRSRRFGSDSVREFQNALPRAFLVPAMRQGPEIKLINTFFAKDFDPRKEVLLDQPVDFQPSERFDGTVQSIEYSPNHVTVRTRQEGNGFLVLLDSYFPGWTVHVDGKPAPLLRAYHFFRAVPLESGMHLLQFKYVPEGLVEGQAVTFLMIVISLAVLLVRAFARLPVNRWDSLKTS
ncbi:MULTISPECIES: YfhO family protein [unclassified Nitrospina]|uniref:YfhO family protein n=1 Tax=unclassified Nitrospina TaxID=2638683 RepID=UPI003F9DBE1F